MRRVSILLNCSFGSALCENASAVLYFSVPTRFEKEQGARVGVGGGAQASKNLFTSTFLLSASGDLNITPVLETKTSSIESAFQMCTF